MKKECAVVQDLLVLYDDDCLQEESRKMVEEHIACCQECRDYYEAGRTIQREEESERAKSELEIQKNATEAVKKLETRTTIRTLLCIVVVIAALVGGLLGCNYITGSDDGISRLWLGIASDDIKVTEVYQLASGDIYCTLESDQNIGTQSLAGLQAPEEIDGEEDWKHIKQDIVIRMKRQSFWEDGGDAAIHKTTIICPTTLDGEVEETGQRYTCYGTQIVFYGKTKSDQMVIWTAGQEIDQATDAIEKKAIQAYLQNGELEKASKECRLLGWNNSDIMEEMQNETSEAMSDSDQGAVVIVHEE